jgi:hypothetical protein
MNTKTKKRYNLILKTWGGKRLEDICKDREINMSSAYSLFKSECPSLFKDLNISLSAFRYTIKSHRDDWVFKEDSVRSISLEKKAERVFSYLKKSEIENMLKNNHSFGMIFDLLKRDYPDFFNCDFISEKNKHF